MADVKIVVHTHGPIFDGRAKAAAHAFIDDAKQEVAKVGAEDVRHELHPGHGYQTGFYHSHVRATQNKVVDSGVIYGPWLEGVGSRNAKSRFKGYHIFRLTTQRLQQKAASIAERILPKYLERMR